VIVPNVTNATLQVAVFSQPSPKYYEVTVKVPSAVPRRSLPPHTITFTDGFFARN
jgi:hypothetical protein